MNAFLERRARPLNLAHRGASAHAPENTLAAFRLAAELGADGLELDAKLSRDGVAVVMHDATVDRTTDGAGRVSDMTLAELKRLDAGSKFGPQFASEPVPTLDEVLDAVGERLIVNVELTNYASRGDGLERKVIDLIARRGLVDRMMVSSFDPMSLRRVKRAAPPIVCGLLYSPDQPIHLRRAWLARLIPGLEARHPHHSMIDLAFVRRCHARGQRVNTWTVNEEADMRRMIAAGVNAVMTDRPDVMHRMLNEHLHCTERSEVHV
jgi:glycerophosphoryl diester phosphodiesterase